MTDADYDELFRTAYPRLVAMGLAMSTERHVAQDLAQETMLRAYRHRDEVAKLDAPMAWCRRVMGNLLIDHHRRRAVEQAAVERMESRSAAAPMPGTGSTDTAHLATTPRWNDLLASLTPQQRLIATLFYADDQPVGVVADTLQIAVGTVKSALSKVRSNLRRALGDTYGEEAFS
jgi:RNA polymerase sigma-70 factor (ECF subfamily)